VHIIIGKDILVYDIPTQLLEEIITDLTFPNPKYLDAIKFGYSVWNVNKVISIIKDNGDGTLSLPRGYIERLLNLAKAKSILVQAEDQRQSCIIAKKIEDHIILRDYQIDAVNKLLALDYGVLKAPAGSGKTVMGLSLIPKLQQKTLWLTHTRPLARQVIERISSFFPNITPGFIGGGKWETGEEITVATVQTLVRNEKKVINELSNSFGMLQIDEAHHTPASTFIQVIRLFSAKYIYGLTATDKRKDRLEDILYATVGPVTSEIHRTSIETEIVTPMVVVKNTKIFPGDESSFSKLIHNLSYNFARNAIIVSDVLKEAYEGNICMVITERKAHAELLFDMIRQKWDFAGVATGNLTKNQIKEQVIKLGRQEITVLVATSNLLGEGFDYAPLNRLFVGLPFRNEVRCEQIVGRVQRKAEGKEDAIIYDYVDSHSLLQHQYRNDSKKGYGCRWNIYKRLGCEVVEV